MEAMRNQKFVVVYTRPGDDEMRVEEAADYEAAEALVQELEDESNSRTLIFRAGSNCDADPIVLDWEDHQ